MSTVNREDALDAVYERIKQIGYEHNASVLSIRQAIRDLPSAQQWIPFQIRPLDEEEKEKFPDWDSILCGNLPDDGQKILVSIKYGEREYVINDEFYYSGYGECYLDSGYDFVTEAVAWMPLPEPWKGEEHD